VAIPTVAGLGGTGGKKGIWGESSLWTGGETLFCGGIGPRLDKREQGLVGARSGRGAYGKEGVKRRRPDAEIRVSFKQKGAEEGWDETLLRRALITGDVEKN